MALVEEFESSYEGSDESSESDMLDASLSVWRGWKNEDEPDFQPVPLDLYTASSIGDYDCVWTVVQRAEEDLNRKNVGGWSALMYASYIGHDTVVNLLLDARCEVNAKNKKGQTPLMLAASCGNESVAFLLIQSGADKEARDKKGWTALFHATYSGHQNMVKFLLDHHANTEVKEPARDLTPFMEAAVEGHEIIVQYFLQHGVEVEARTSGGDTARSLALDKGHTKIVSLIDNHLLANTFPLRAEPGLDRDFSSSDESFQNPSRRSLRKIKPRGANIGEGPEAFAKLMAEKQRQSPGLEAPREPEDNPFGLSAHTEELSGSVVLRGLHPQRLPAARDTDYPDFERRSSGSDGGSRGKLSPAHSPGMRNSPKGRMSPSSPGPAHSPGLKQPGRVSPHSGLPDSSADSEHMSAAPSRPPPGFGALPSGIKPALKPADRPAARHSPNTAVFNNDKLPFPNAYHKGYGQLPQLGHLTPDQSLSDPRGPPRTPSDQALRTAAHAALSNNNDVKQDAQRPKDLDSLLNDLGLSKYMKVFDEQDVDLTVFLTLTESDLKEVGIKLFGPRRKMTNAISRWHEDVKGVGGEAERAYTSMLEAKLGEQQAQLHKALEGAEVAEAALEQEKQVRAVMEGAYMEGRAAFQHVQHVAADNRARCASMASTLIHINQYEAELARRFGAESQFSRSTGHGQLGLADPLHDTLRLSKDDHHPHIQRLPTQQLIRKVQQWTEEMVVHISVITKNTDRLLRGGFQAAQNFQRVQLTGEGGS